VGREGKARRLPSLKVKEISASGESTECTYTARLGDELHWGQWYRLAVAWNGAETGGNRVHMALNGVARPVTLRGTSLAAPAKLNPAAPLVVGGDRGWSNVPLHLGAFAVYDRALAQPQLLKLDRTALKPAPGATASTARELPQYEKLAALNKPAAWAVPSAPLSVREAKGEMLHVGVSTSKFQNPLTLRLKSAVSLDTRVKSVNFWVCQPPRGQALFRWFRSSWMQKKLRLKGRLSCSSAGTVCRRIRARAGLWLYRFVDVPRGARKFLGFKWKAEDYGGERTGDPTDALFIKDIGLERIDYARASLYYVVGNYRDNFGDTRYNARAPAP
jgi:hypothetical protein